MEDLEEEYESHDPDDCASCRVMNNMINHHQMTLVMPCFDDSMFWVCHSCEVAERWVFSEDRDATAALANFAIHLHVVPELTVHLHGPTG